MGGVLGCFIATKKPPQVVFLQPSRNEAVRTAFSFHEYHQIFFREALEMLHKHSLPSRQSKTSSEILIIPIAKIHEFCLLVHNITFYSKQKGQPNAVPPQHPTTTLPLFDASSIS